MGCQVPGLGFDNRVEEKVQGVWGYIEISC